MSFWTEHTIHFIDFEGGLSSGIVEYGVVTVRGGEVVATRGRACAPTGRMRPEETAVHGLTAAVLGGAAPFAADFEVFARLRESGPLAAHHATAENTLLKACWPYARAAPDFAQVPPLAGGAVEWGPWIDTGRLGPAALGAGAPGRLADLVAWAGLQNELDELASGVCPGGRRRYHCALYDALAGALILLEVAKRPGWGDKSLPWLLEQSVLNPAGRERLRQGELF